MLLMWFVICQRSHEKTGNIELQEEYSGKMKIQEVTEFKYLGNIITSEGTNMMDLQGKYNRGIGTIEELEQLTR